MKKIICLAIFSLILTLPLSGFAKNTRFLGDEYYFDIPDVQNFNVVAALSANSVQGFRFFNANTTGTISSTKTPLETFPNFMIKQNWEASSVNLQTWKETIQTQDAGELVSVEDIPNTFGVIYVVKKELGRDRYYNVIAQKVYANTLYVVIFSTTERYVNQAKTTAITIISSITPRNQPQTGN